MGFRWCEEEGGCAANEMFEPPSPGTFSVTVLGMLVYNLLFAGCIITEQSFTKEYM